MKHLIKMSKYKIGKMIKKINNTTYMYILVQIHTMYEVNTEDFGVKLTPFES